MQALQKQLDAPAHAAEVFVSEAALQVLWVGGLGGMEGELVQRAHVPFKAVSAAGLHGVGLRRLPGNLLKLWRGFRQAQAIIKDFRPDVLFFTGGFVAAPVALAGRSIPTVLYLPDIEPGLAIRALARFADGIAVTAEASRAYFSTSRRVVVTGYPVRPELQTWERRQAQEALGLDASLPTLLVFGGSKGARSINRALFAALPALLPDMQVVHVSGALDWGEAEAQLAALPGLVGSALAGRYHAYPYLHAEMGAALAAADLAVSRAGASVLGEFPLFGLPSVLVPYPHAWRYQRTNAEYLQDHGAAHLVIDADLPEQLVPTVRRLLLDPAALNAMRLAARRLARPGAAAEIARLLVDLAAPSATSKEGSVR